MVLMKLMTKSHWVGLSLIFVLIIGIYIYKDANVMVNLSNDQPYVEQKNIQTSGYENGQKVFDVKTERLRQQSYQHVLYATNIIDGNVYNENGDNVIGQLTGTFGRINTSFKSILATKNITAIIHPSSATKSIQVKADEFRYSHSESRANFSKSAQLKIRKINIFAESFDYFDEKNILFFSAGFSLETVDSTTNVNRAILFIDKSEIKASKNVKTNYNRKQSTSDSDQINHLLKTKTTINSKELLIDFKNNEKSVVTYIKNVAVKQPDKTMLANRLKLNLIENVFEASENVSFTFNNIGWLLNKKRTIKNPDIKKMLTLKTSISANYGKFNAENNTVTLKKSIKLKQQNFKLTCENLVYDIDNELLIFSGNVIVKKFGIEHFNSKKLIIDIKNETFRTKSSQNLSEIMIEL